jgi:hypothetical protein
MIETCLDCGYYEGDKEFKVGMEFNCKKVNKHIQAELLEDIVACEEKLNIVES